MTREEIKNKVIEIIADKIGFGQNQIKESTNFKSDLGTDSLDDVELVMEFERVFGIRILDEEMLTIRTVGETIDGICKKLGVSICKQQQSEVDLEDALNRWQIYHEYPENYDDLLNLARYFYNLGLNARKE